MSVIPVLMTTDENYIDPLMVTIWSARTNTPLEHMLDITVLCHSAFGQEFKDRLLNLNNRLENVYIHFFEIDDEDFKEGKSNAHIALAAYYRLAAVKCIDRDKCVYIDGDVIVETDLYDLLNENVEDYYVGGVPDITLISRPNQAMDYMSKSNIQAIDDYINSGILVMNLKKIRKDNLFTTFINQISTEYNPWLDQDVINRVCHGKIKLLDWTYNHISYFEDFAYESLIGPARRIGKGDIFHYTMGVKPWDNYNYKYADHWWKYAREVFTDEEYDSKRKQIFRSSESGMIRSLIDFCKKERTVVLAGYTDISVRVFCLLQEALKDVTIVFADNDERRRKLHSKTQTILSMDEANELYSDAAWINMAQGRRKEVSDCLKHLGINENKMTDYYERYIGEFRWIDKQIRHDGIMEHLIL